MQRSSSSPMSSELCVEKDLRNGEVSNNMRSEETESSNTQWTDEKHSLYLESMEASFVNQLYDSLDTMGGCSNQECSSEPRSCRHMRNDISTPGQFKVFKDGSWERVSLSNSRREMLQSRKVEKSAHILANPWIQHYRSSGRHQTRISPYHQKQAPASAIVDSSALLSGGQDSLGSSAEGTDQNFADEIPNKEKPSRVHRQKCRKVSAASSLSNDQVVPFAKLSLIDNIVKGSPK